MADLFDAVARLIPGHSTRIARRQLARQAQCETIVALRSLNPIRAAAIQAELGIRDEELAEWKPRT